MAQLLQPGAQHRPPRKVGSELDCMTSIALDLLQATARFQFLSRSVVLPKVK